MVKFDTNNVLNQPVDLMDSLGFSGMAQRDDCVNEPHGNFSSGFESYPALDPSAMYNQEPQEFKDFLSSLSSMSPGSNSSPSPTTFGDSSPQFNTLRRRPSSSSSSTVGFAHYDHDTPLTLLFILELCISFFPFLFPSFRIRSVSLASFPQV